jgi:hypothetical protein
MPQPALDFQLGYATVSKMGSEGMAQEMGIEPGSELVDWLTWEANKFDPFVSGQFFHNVTTDFEF